MKNVLFTTSSPSLSVIQTAFQISRWIMNFNNAMKCTTWIFAPGSLTFFLPFFSYQVMYWEDDTKPDTIGKVRLSGNYTLVNITGLKANTAYYLSVAAFNTAGPGPQSVPINSTTKKPRESIPRRTLKVSLHGNLQFGIGLSSPCWVLHLFSFTVS